MHSPLVEKFLELAPYTGQNSPLLDLACGQGRNGLKCLEHEYSVVFADKNTESLEVIQSKIKGKDASVWLVDFELNERQFLATNAYSAVLVFRYLHRPLMENIKATIIPGGYVVYETFTLENKQFGRPNRTEYLLKQGELLEIFSSWQVLHYFEGECLSETSGKMQAVARIVAQKPQ